MLDIVNFGWLCLLACPPSNLCTQIRYNFCPYLLHALGVRHKSVLILDHCEYGLLHAAWPTSERCFVTDHTTTGPRCWNFASWTGAANVVPALCAGRGQHMNYMTKYSSLLPHGFFAQSYLHNNNTSCHINFRLLCDTRIHLHSRLCRPRGYLGGVQTALHLKANLSSNTHMPCPSLFLTAYSSSGRASVRHVKSSVSLPPSPLLPHTPLVAPVAYL